MTPPTPYGPGCFMPDVEPAAPCACHADGRPTDGNAASAALEAVARLLAATSATGGDVTVQIRAGGYRVTVAPESAPPADPARTPSEGKIGPRRPASAIAERSAAERSRATRVELLRHFLSVRERLILAALAECPGCKATDVFERCKAEVKLSEFWGLWSNLQQRRLIADADPEARRGGFCVSAAWVVDLVEDELAPGHPPAGEARPGPAATRR